MEYLNRRVADSWGFGRTEAYRGSTTDKQDREVLKLKENIKMNNKVRIENAHHAIQRQADYGMTEEQLMEAIDGLFSWGMLQRVRFMARGKRRREDGRAIHYNCDSYLNHEHASYYDVYVHDDDTAHARVKEQLKKKFCPTLSEIEELEWKVQELKWSLRRA